MNRSLYQRQLKNSSLMIAKSAQFTLVNEHFKRIRKQRSSTVFSIAVFIGILSMVSICKSSIKGLGDSTVSLKSSGNFLSDITKTSKCSKIEKILIKNATPKTLVIWDLDGVIVTTHILRNPECTRILRYEFSQAAKQLMLKSIMPLRKKGAKIDESYQIVDTQVKDIIKDLQNKGVLNIACTGLPVTDIKHKTISNAHIHFSKSFAGLTKEQRQKIRKLFTRNEAKNKRLFGYVVAGDKAKAINKLVRKLNEMRSDDEQIDSVIVIEDYDETLYDIGSALADGVNFTGIHYTFVKNNTSVDDIVNAYLG